MSLGPLMIGLTGTRLTGEEIRRLRHPMVGGVLLFTRNYADPQQLRDLVAAIHEVRQPSLLVAVDQEGGRVQRFRDGFTQLPPVATLRVLFERAPEEAEQAATRLGWLMAAELRAVDVDFSFAPVLDLDFGISEVIGDRAFHRSPEVVTRLAQAWCRGVRRAGMVAIGKHFPGHGGCAPDSHVAYPEDDRALADLENEDLVPFRRLIANGLEGIMMSHVQYPRVDATAAGYSDRWIGDLLRGRLGFEGAIFSDDLGMAAADTAGDYPARAVRSLSAGCDMVVVGNEREVLGDLLAADLPVPPAASMRLARLKGRGGGSPRALEADADYAGARALAERLCAGHTGELEV